MIQSNELKCQFHQGSDINFACMNEQCSKMRYGCFQCVQQNHHEHFQDIKEFASIKQDVVKCEQYGLIIIEKIDKFIKDSMGNLMKMKEQLEQSQQKYQKFPYELPMNDLKSVLDEIALYSQGKYQKMLEKLDANINELKCKLSMPDSIINPKEPEQEQNLENEMLSLEILSLVRAKQAQFKKLFHQGDLEQSMDVINEVLNLCPDDEEALHVKGQQPIICQPIFQTIKDFQKRPYQSMIKFYEEIQIMRWFRSIEVPNIILLVNSYIIDRNYEKAMELCQPLLEKDPQNYNYLYIWGKCLFHKEKFAEAYSILISIDQKEQEDAQVKCLLGESLAALGAVEEGIAYLREAIICGHESKEAIQMKIDSLTMLKCSK